jgi:hypothetical protein
MPGAHLETKGLEPGRPVFDLSKHLPHPFGLSLSKPLSPCEQPFDTSG